MPSRGRGSGAEGFIPGNVFDFLPRDPANHCLGLDDRDRIQNRREESVQPYKEQVTRIPQPYSRLAPAAQDDQLLTEDEDLCLKRGSCPEQRARAEAKSRTRPSRVPLVHTRLLVTPDLDFGRHNMIFNILPAEAELYPIIEKNLGAKEEKIVYARRGRTYTRTVRTSFKLKPEHGRRTRGERKPILNPKCRPVVS
jgi:hypothetical protein